MIPIRNVYYLLLYAWDTLEERDDALRNVEPESNVLDLLAGVLNNGVDRLLRLGLDRTYVQRREAIPGIRGKFDFSATIKSDLLRRSIAICEFDEMDHDTLHNRILKSTIGNIVRTTGLDESLRKSLRATWHRLHEISEIRLTRRVFDRVQLHRNNRVYRFLLDVCRLLFECLIPNERDGRYWFRDFLRNKRQMRILFERFIRNFYRHHVDAFEVAAESVRWECTTGSTASLELLPGMRTDVVLRAPGRVIVIDAKYYLDTFQEYRGRTTLRSGHLYQLFTYVRNVSLQPDSEYTVEGLLVYPLTGRSLDFESQIHGHRMRAKTLDLRQKWEKIHETLLEFLG